MTQQAAALNCADLTPWFEWRINPKWVGWYEIRSFGCDDGMQLFWNGSDWGYWETDGVWNRWRPLATDKWRGLTSFALANIVIGGG